MLKRQKDLIRCHCLLCLCLKKIRIHYSLNQPSEFSPVSLKPEGKLSLIISSFDLGIKK